MSDQLIDNQSVKLSDVINTVLPSSKSARFAVGYFFISGFNAISENLHNLDNLKLLIGSTSNRETVEQLTLGYRNQRLIAEHQRQQTFSRLDVAVGDTVSSIRRDISELQPSEVDQKSITTLAELISSGKVEVRVHTRGVLHAKAYIFDYENPQPTSKGIGIIGSSNLTQPGLENNTELNVQVDDNADIITQEGMHKDLCNWFDSLWDEAQPFSEQLMTELNESWAVSVADPYDVYLKMLYELVRVQLDIDESSILLPEEIPLASYQKVAVQQAIRMVNRHGGAFVADVVGVGKSFIGSAVARYFYESERRRPLILCPKPLEEMWKIYNSRFNLNAEIVPVSLLTERNGTDDFSEISNILEEPRYQDCNFVLVDESHYFRHSTNQRYHVFQDYMTEGRDRKVLLMTATPYNKSADDLYHQIKLFHHEENTLIPVEPRNLRSYFTRVKNGERRLQDLLSHILVRRTRWQLLRWYGYDSETDRPINPQDFRPYLDGDKRAYLKFTNEQGETEKRFFPNRRLQTLEYCIDDVYQDEFDQPLYEPIAKRLEGEDDDQGTRNPTPGFNQLKYARYGLYEYLKDPYKNDSSYEGLARAGISLRGLIKSGLFKRLESSVFSFRKSIERQVEVHKHFLDALDGGVVAAGRDLSHLLELDNDAFDEGMDSFMQSVANGEARIQYDIKVFDDDALRRDVRHDLEVFEQILGIVTRDRIPPDKDAKLQVFLKLLPGLCEEGKLIVFTQFKDTADYLWDNIPSALKKDAAKVTGENENLSAIVNRFAPKANLPDGLPGKTAELNLLISTDRLSEGLNLQDGSQVLNYDLHWNPVKLIQRFGRIDRIGSEHEEIYAYNFLPEKAVEAELDLTTKLEARISEINRIMGLDSQVLDPGEQVNREAVYAVYEERAGEHLGQFEASQEETTLELSVGNIEEFFRDLQQNDPEEFERIRNLRDGLRTARATGDRKLLVLGRAGDFVKLYVRTFSDEQVDIDTTDAIGLLKCDPDEKAIQLPNQLNDILITVKLHFYNEVEEQWNQRKTKSRMTPGQRYVLDQLEFVRQTRPHLDDDRSLARLIEAVSATRQRRFQRASDRLRRNKIEGEMLLRRVRQLYYDCALHLERVSFQEEEVDARIPRIVAVAALV